MTGDEKDKHLRSDGAMDVVRADTLMDAEENGGEIMLSVNGMAMEHFGKPYSELTRKEQRLITMTIKGINREYKERIKTLKSITALDANVRIARMSGASDKISAFVSRLADEADELLGMDNMDVSYHKDFKKTRAGTIRRNLRYGKILTSVIKTHVETQVLLAKMADEKEKAVFVKEDNRTVNITSDTVKNRLGKFAKGEIVDQSGDGNDSDAGADD